MQIFAYDPYQDREAMAHFGAKKVETLEELLHAQRLDRKKLQKEAAYRIRL